MATEAKTTEAAASAPVDVTKTPEFAAAVAAAVSQSQAPLLALIEKMGAMQHGAAPTPDVLSELTAAIIGMQDPKNEQRRISPAEAAKRTAAFNQMGMLITEMRAQGQTAKYQVAHKIYLGDLLLEPLVPVGNGQWADNIVLWNGAPSPGLRPLDARAEAIFEQYLIYIGGSTKNPAGIVEQPTWTQGNIVMVGTPTETAAKHGQVKEVEPAMVDATAFSGTSVKSTSDRAGEKSIRVLGTIAEPARVTEHGSIPSAHIS